MGRPDNGKYCSLAEEDNSAEAGTLLVEGSNDSCAQQPGGYPPPQGNPPQQGHPPQNQQMDGPQQPRGGGFGMQSQIQTTVDPDGNTTTVVRMATHNCTVDGQSLFPRPSHITCPYCKQDVMTRPVYHNGLGVWGAFCGCCICGCILGCCLIPFCINDFKDADHSCSNCGKHVGTYQMIS